MQDIKRLRFEIQREDKIIIYVAGAFRLSEQNTIVLSR
jgi:hypothetical protein